MTEARCATHDLQLGPDGQCVLCRRRSLDGGARSSLPSDRKPPAQLSLAVGLAIAVGLIAVASTLWMLSAPTPPTSQRSTAIEPPQDAQPSTAATAAPAPAVDEATKRLANADFWKPQGETLLPEAVAQADAHAQPSDGPLIPSDPAALMNKSPVATIEQAPSLAETERDRQRHEQIEAELAARAKQVAEEREHAAIVEARGKVRIEMWSAEWCGNCQAAKAYLADSRLRYELHDVDREVGARAEMRRLNPRRTIPTFRIDGMVHVGFSVERFERTLDEAARKHIGL